MGELLRPSELARMMGVRQQRIYVWVKKGLPLLKTEQGTRIDLDEANEFFKKNGITPNQNTTPTKTVQEQKQDNKSGPSNESQTSTSILAPKVTSVDTQKGKAASTLFEEGQFLVWSKGTAREVTVGKVTEKDPEVNVAVVKCNDGEEAVFSIKDLKKFIREGKVSLLQIDTLLELIADELHYHNLDELANQTLQIKNLYLKKISNDEKAVNT